MRDYLVFTLTATLAAMGGPAGHERRGAETWPGRSAILGILAAASGVRRNGDFAALDRLHLAVAVFEQGGHLRDWHTVQTVPTAALKHPQTRAQALKVAASRQALKTMITKRDYRVAPLYGVAVWNGDLDPLRQALEAPVFTLYLGRKSCPLAFPVSPKIIRVDNPATALTHVELPPWQAKARAGILVSSPEALHGLEATRIETRHDNPIDRETWHFGLREEAVCDVDIVPWRPQ